MSVDGDIHLPEGVGLVIVGRNEGARLQRSLARTRDKGRAIYVDSGSSDHSSDKARSLGFHVLELDPARPFTAARGRNEGFEALLKAQPELRYVHFQDGDCLVDTAWMAAGREALDAAPQVALVAGVLREQNAEASVFNRLLDMEWQQPPGDNARIGGNAMVRVEDFRAVGGFNADLPAGEEGDLHIRLRAAGHIVRRIDAPMAYHDADMTRYSQWWQRCLRGGQAAAEAYDRHSDADPHAQRMQRSNFFWGLAVPAAGVVGLPVTLGLSSMLPVAGYAALYAKILKAQVAAGRPLSDAELYARFTVLAKFPQALGQLRYHVMRARGKKTRVIDWRDAGTSGPN